MSTPELRPAPSSSGTLTDCSLLPTPPPEMRSGLRSRSYVVYRENSASAPRSRETVEGADACGARGGRDGRKMATATIALVSESLAAGDGRQLAGLSRSLGQGVEGPLCAQRLDRASYGLSCGSRHAGRRRSGSARLRPWLWLGCSFRLEDSSFRLLGGVGRPRAAQLDPHGGGPLFAEAGRQLSRRLVASGSSGACSRPARLRPVLGTRKGRTHWHLLYATVQRSGFPILLSRYCRRRTFRPPPPPFKQSFCSWLCWRTRQSVPALVTGLVGIIRLC